MGGKGRNPYLLTVPLLWPSLPRKGLEEMSGSGEVIFSHPRRHAPSRHGDLAQQRVPLSSTLPSDTSPPTWAPTLPKGHALAEAESCDSSSARHLSCALECQAEEHTDGKAQGGNWTRLCPTLGFPRPAFPTFSSAPWLGLARASGWGWQPSALLVSQPDPARGDSNGFRFGRTQGQQRRAHAAQPRPQHEASVYSPSPSPPGLSWNALCHSHPCPLSSQSLPPPLPDSHMSGLFCPSSGLSSRGRAGSQKLQFFLASSATTEAQTPPAEARRPGKAGRPWDQAPEPGRKRRRWLFRGEAGGGGSTRNPRDRSVSHRCPSFGEAARRPQEIEPRRGALISWKSQRLPGVGSPCRPGSELGATELEPRAEQSWLPPHPTPLWGCQPRLPWKQPLESPVEFCPQKGTDAAAALWCHLGSPASRPLVSGSSFLCVGGDGVWGVPGGGEYLGKGSQSLSSLSCPSFLPCEEVALCFAS